MEERKGCRMKRILCLLIPALLVLPGCVEGETGQSAMMGTLLGTAVGALSGDKEDRGKNALMGAGVGLLGGSLYGKHKESQRLKEENAILRRELEQQEMRRELERLRIENERLRKGHSDERKHGAAGVLRRGTL